MKKPVDKPKENSTAKNTKVNAKKKENEVKNMSVEPKKIVVSSKVFEKVKRIDVVYERETIVYENDKLLSSKKEEVVESYKGDKLPEPINQKSALIQKIEQKISSSQKKTNVSKIIDIVLLTVVAAQVVGLLYILLK